MAKKPEIPRIAFYLPSLRGGGAERVMLTLANGFAERGFRVDLILSAAEGPYLAQKSDKIRLVDLNSFVKKSVPGLVRYLRSERPQAMISATTRANLVAFVAVKLSGQPTRLLVTEHSTFSRANSGTGLKGALLRILMRWAYTRCHLVTAVSVGAADDLSRELKLPRDRIQTIYNPIVSDDLIARSHEPVPALASMRRPIILAAGRLAKPKDYPTLLHAFALLRKRMEASLVILGEGELREELERLSAELEISEQVVMPGFSDNPYAWMRQADLFVLSSAWEGFANVLVEAMACDIPVVSTDCSSGPSEILEDGKWGRLVPVGDRQALAEAMHEALNCEIRLDTSKRADAFKVEGPIQSYLDLLKV